MMLTMEATAFDDPLRERDLADRGITATVTINAGPPRTLVIQMDPADFDVFISGNYRIEVEGYEEGYAEGYEEAMSDIEALA